MKYETLFFAVVEFLKTTLCWVGVVLLFTSCAGSPIASTTPTPPVKYKLTLTGTIDNISFDGIGVGSSSSTHQMTIQSQIPVNWFTMQSCHRSRQFTDVIKVPWYDWSGDNKSFSFEYDEAPTIEDSGDCILRFCAFSNKVGKAPVACAIVDFHSPRYTLPGTNICDGEAGATTGTAICHTQAGLIERYRFPAPVVVAPQVVDPTGGKAPYWISGQCEGKFLDDAQTLFEYQVPSQECAVIFMEKAKPHRRAKLSVIPYDQAQYLGGQ